MFTLLISFSFSWDETRCPVNLFKTAFFCLFTVTHMLSLTQIHHSRSHMCKNSRGFHGFHSGLVLSWPLPPVPDCHFRVVEDDPLLQVGQHTSEDRDGPESAGLIIIIIVIITIRAEISSCTSHLMTTLRVRKTSLPPRQGRWVLESGLTNPILLLISCSGQLMFPYRRHPPFPNSSFPERTGLWLCVSDATGMTNMIHLITCFSLVD